MPVTAFAIKFFWTFRRNPRLKHLFSGVREWSWWMWETSGEGQNFVSFKEPCKRKMLMMFRKNGNLVLLKRKCVVKVLRLTNERSGLRKTLIPKFVCLEINFLINERLWFWLNPSFCRRERVVSILHSTFIFRRELPFCPSGRNSWQQNEVYAFLFHHFSNKLKSCEQSKIHPNLKYLMESLITIPNTLRTQ